MMTVIVGYSDDGYGDDYGEDDDSTWLLMLLLVEVMGLERRYQ